MENKEKELEGKELDKAIRVIVIGIALFLIAVFYSFSSNNNNPSSVHISESENDISEDTQQLSVKANSTFSEISLADQNRLREIIVGVMQNTIPVTESLKNELKTIFAKYNTTDEEKTDFFLYGPYFASNFQGLFYTDALQAVSVGYPVKSVERSNLEKEALSRGLMTSERVEANDELMKSIASHQPITGPDGRQIIFTEDVIKDTMKNILSITNRLILLLE